MEKNMKNMHVRDLMVPIDEYPVVAPETSLLDAIQTLNEAQKNLPPGRQPYRAVLVKDASGKVVGKLGQFAFLKALEPKSGMLSDLSRLTQSGVSDELVSTMVDHYRFFEENLCDMCARGRNIAVRDAMHPILHSIDESASLTEAINRIVIYQQQSILVMRGGTAVGILRLPDLCDAVARQMQTEINERREG